MQAESASFRSFFQFVSPHVLPNREETITKKFANFALLEKNVVLAYKRSYQLDKVLKGLMKEFKTSITEKGINSLYLSFGFIHYVEEEVEYDM